MPPATDRRSMSGSLGVAIAAAVVVLHAASTFAQVRPRVDNPHGKFRDECSMCHGADAWKITKIAPKFDHAKYGPRLEGAHASANCMVCHTSLEFAQARTQCVSCHQDPHRGEMGIDCARCHGARSFTDRGPMVRAHQLTRFPLTGSHAGLDCESCHAPTAQGHLQYVGTTAECQGCHMPQYQSAKNPDHVAGHYPTDCATCHASTTWIGAGFNHDATTFPLTGKHRGAACSSCHGDGVYAGKPIACMSCHTTDYNTAQPPHLAAGFAASACASCHTTTTFTGATFNHDGPWFPIYTGRHAGMWSSCATCHTNTSNYAVFTCLSCHPHDDKASTDSHHAGRSGYSYDSNACYRCHPSGRAG